MFRPSLCRPSGPVPHTRALWSWDRNQVTAQGFESTYTVAGSSQRSGRPRAGGNGPLRPSQETVQLRVCNTGRCEHGLGGGSLEHEGKRRREDTTFPATRLHSSPGSSRPSHTSHQRGTHWKMAWRVVDILLVLQLKWVSASVLSRREPPWTGAGDPQSFAGTATSEEQSPYLSEMVTQPQKHTPHISNMCLGSK